MAGMWGLYAQAVGSLRHPVRTVRELRAGVLPVAHAASLRPHETGVALRADGVDLAAIFRLICWVGLAEMVVLAVILARTVDSAVPFGLMVLLGIVLSPLAMAVVGAVLLPVVWYGVALAARIGFRAVGPWMSWQEARALVFAGLLPHLAVWAVGLSLILDVAQSWPDLAAAFPQLFRVLARLLSIVLVIQEIRLFAGLRGISGLQAFGGNLFSGLAFMLPLALVALAVGVLFHLLGWGWPGP